MQGFRRAFVITGFVILGLGSNLAWHYPRPEALGLKLDSPQALIVGSQSMQTSGVRGRPNEDWSDLLVESSEKEKAGEILKSLRLPTPPAQAQKWETPAALLADLAHLPGVKEANVVVQNGRQAVVMLSMQHGAFAADGRLLSQAVQTVLAYRPQIQAENIKVLDGKGSDLNYAALSPYTGQVHPLQLSVQAQLDGFLGPRRALFYCRLQRAKERKIHLQSVLYLAACSEEESKTTLELVNKSQQAWVDKQNKCLKTNAAWQVQEVVYPFLGELNSAEIQRNWRVDRSNGLTLEPSEVKEWALTQRTLPLEEMKALQWGLSSPPSTPGQLALGLGALAPALFGWCLLVPWLWRRHQLSPSASATL